jgi:hypothetical protein
MVGRGPNGRARLPNTERLCGELGLNMSMFG